jgi:hypothetical protein
MYSVKRGAITSVNEIVDIFDHICDQLGVKLEESSILIAENSFTSKTNKEKLAEILFEKHYLKSNVNQTDLIKRKINYF